VFFSEQSVYITDNRQMKHTYCNR